MKFKKPFSLSSASDSLNVSPAAPSDGYRPEVWLPNLAGLKCLPASGEITFRFTRKKVELSGDDKLSGCICLESILGVECDKDDEPLQDVVDKLFEEAAKEEKAEPAEVED